MTASNPAVGELVATVGLNFNGGVGVGARSRGPIPKPETHPPSGYSDQPKVARSRNTGHHASATVLTLTEETLLLLHGREGTSLPVQRHSFECAMAGAVLLDLAFENRIDTDQETLLVIDDTPTGNPMLDGVLSRIAALA